MLERRLGIGEGFEAAAPVRVVVVEIRGKVTVRIEPLDNGPPPVIRWHKVTPVEIVKTGVERIRRKGL